MSLAARMLALRRGEISFVVFWQQTQPLWQFLAARLLYRWGAVIGVGQPDVVQELITHAWIFMGRWDPARGVRIDRYVLFNSIDKAKKWLDKQRQARTSVAPSRSPVLGQRDTIEAECSGDVVVELLPVITARWLAALLETMPEQDRVVVTLLARTRSAEAAAVYIYDDPLYRRRFRLGNEDAARRLVRRTAMMLCDNEEFMCMLEED